MADQDDKQKVEKPKSRKKYVLAQSSRYHNIRVGDKTVSKVGSPVELTQEQVTTLSSMDGVEIEEARAPSQESGKE